jgi:hypothetical protein
MRTLSCLVALLMFLAPAAHAGEPQGKTYWHAETNGLPVSSEAGAWIDAEGPTVELQFTGGHLLGAGTSFEARWLSPYTSKGKPARFEGSWELDNYNDLGDEIDIRSAFRFKERGDAWSEWIEMNQVFKPGRNFMGAGEGYIGGLPRQTRFEWRLTAAIKAPTYLSGGAALSVN